MTKVATNGERVNSSPNDNGGSFAYVKVIFVGDVPILSNSRFHSNKGELSCIILEIAKEIAGIVSDKTI